MKKFIKTSFERFINENYKIVSDSVYQKALNSLLHAIGVEIHDVTHGHQTDKRIQEIVDNYLNEIKKDKLEHSDVITLKNRIAERIDSGETEILDSLEHIIHGAEFRMAFQDIRNYHEQKLLGDNYLRDQSGYQLKMYQTNSTLSCKEFSIPDDDVDMSKSYYLKVGNPLIKKARSPFEIIEERDIKVAKDSGNDGVVLKIGDSILKAVVLSDKQIEEVN